MAQTTHERTSWILTVPFHASTPQVLGSGSFLFDLTVFASRGQFRTGAPVQIMVENLDTQLTLTGLRVESSPDGAAWADSGWAPSPVVPLGRTSHTLGPADDARYLRVLGRHEGSPQQVALVRVTLSTLSGGHPLT